MQSLDNSLTTYRKPRGIGKGLLTARQGHGAPNPKQIPEAARAASVLAEEINGFAGSNIGELIGTPLTAHFLGGCPIGASPEQGVIDPYHRLYGHPGISVVDGAAVSANLGVNPSLTITAQAERAMSYWPNKGEPDVRPNSAAYERSPRSREGAGGAGGRLRRAEAAVPRHTGGPAQELSERRADRQKGLHPPPSAAPPAGSPPVCHTGSFRPCAGRVRPRNRPCGGVRRTSRRRRARRPRHPRGRTSASRTRNRSRRGCRSPGSPWRRPAAPWG